MQSFLWALHFLFFFSKNTRKFSRQRRFHRYKLKFFRIFSTFLEID